MRITGCKTHDASWGAILVLLVVASGYSGADPVSEPPAGWRDRVRPVPEMDISGADPAVQQVMTETRLTLAGMLADRHAHSGAIGDVYGRLGAFYQLNAVIAAAEQCYLNAIALDPGNFRWHYYLGDLLLKNGRAEEALSRFERARQLDPDYRPMRLKLAQLAYELNRIEEAEQELLVLAEASGLQAMANFYLGQIALQRRDYRLAVERFERALALDPQADRIHYPLAQALRALGEREQAREHLSRHGTRLPTVADPLIAELNALNSGARPHFVRGVVAVKRQEYPLAVEAFEQGLELAPDNVDARTSYARALYLNGQPEPARQQLEHVLLQDPELDLAPFLLGLMLDESGDTSRASDLYRRTLGLEPGHAGAHFYLAGVLYRNGDYAAAAEHYAATAEANPDVTVAALLRLVALSHNGAPDAEVAARLLALQEARPEDPQLQYAAGRLLALSEDATVRDARRALELVQALALTIPAPPHLELLALAHAANGDFEQAHLLEQQLSFVPPWLGGIDTEWLEAAIIAFEEGRLFGPAWRKSDPFLQPPPVQANGPMREYPVAVPY